MNHNIHEAQLTHLISLLDGDALNDAAANIWLHSIARKNRDDLTAILQSAVTHNSATKVFQKLLEYGADPDAKGHYHESALFRAIAKDQMNQVLVMLDYSESGDEELKDAVKTLTLIPNLK